MHLLAGSLARYLRTDISRFPDWTHYLIADQDLVALWRDRFANLGPGLAIGISWRGGSTVEDVHRRIISLESWQKIFAAKNVNFINLQYGECASEIRSLRDNQGITIHDWDDADPLKDLEGHAAQIAALDLVITTANTTAHMAGSLGVPAWVMVPSIPSWRWLLKGDTVPWYQSVRLFRQSRPDDWNDVTSRVATELTNFKSAKHPGVRQSESDLI